MSQNSFQTSPPELGYVFFPAKYNHSPGFSRLEVYLVQEPSDEHIDPKSMHIPVRSMDELVDEVEIYHPWDRAETRTVCAGRITLVSLTNKEIEVYTFGGELEIFPGDETTLCKVTSTAPLIDLHRPSATIQHLVEEIDILFAERRAAWLHNPDEYLRRLALVKAEILYPACLQALSAKLHKLLDLDLPTETDLKLFISSEIKALKENSLWPEPLPALEDIL